MNTNRRTIKGAIAGVTAISLTAGLVATAVAPAASVRLDRESFLPIRAGLLLPRRPSSAHRGRRLLHLKLPSQILPSHVPFVPDMQPDAVIIANPHAGGGRAAKSALKANRILTSFGITTTVHLPQSLPELHSVTQRVAHENPSVVLACGGDGTVHHILQHTIPANITLGIIPSGTGNDIARNIGLPTSANDSYLRNIASLIHQKHFDKVDASLISRGNSTHWSLGVISAGFDSAVNERANRMKFGQGTMRYVSALMAELVPFKLHNFTVMMDGVTYTDTALLIAVGNGRGYGGGMRICPDANMTDGLLDVTWVGKAPRRTVLRLFPRIYSGRHVEHNLVMTYKVSEVSITSHESVIYADGERIGPPPVHIKAMPRAVKVLWRVEA